jgi:hypothetical protein
VAHIMTTRNIGGPLDWATLYGRDQHRPTDGEALQAEIRRTYCDGLRPVLQALREAETMPQVSA